MGALHEGHAFLLRKGRQIAGKNGLLVSSIFVNPTQFGPHEDFHRYPRPFEKDRKVCAAAGVDLLFHPRVEDLYPQDASTFVQEDSVSTGLCGAVRPGHFRGVCTVVLKLFELVRPQYAVFGRKDYQQCMVLSRMVRDLFLEVSLVFVETVRERDGLALSSRNQYLTPEQRAQAPVLYQGLQAAQATVRVGETDPERIRAVAAARIESAPLALIEYIQIVDASTLQPLTAVDRPAIMAVAVRFGQTRLIDNISLA
jgi:pantoate--beta-alanine ligase